MNGESSKSDPANCENQTSLKARAPRGLPGGLYRHAVSRRQDRRFYDGKSKVRLIASAVHIAPDQLYHYWNKGGFRRVASGFRAVEGAGCQFVPSPRPIDFPEA